MSNDNETERFFQEEHDRHEAARREYEASHDMIAVADAKALSDRLHDMIASNSDADQLSGQSGKTIRLVLDVPQEWVMLAAWTAMREADRRMGRQRELSPMVEDQPSGTYLKRAKRQIWRDLYHSFHNELHWLSIGGHPILKPEEQEPQKTVNPDDDIPFY